MTFNYLTLKAFTQDNYGQLSVNFNNNAREMEFLSSCGQKEEHESGWAEGWTDGQTQRQADTVRQTPCNTWC